MISLFSYYNYLQTQQKKGFVFYLKKKLEGCISTNQVLNLDLYDH